MVPLLGGTDQVWSLRQTRPFRDLINQPQPHPRLKKIWSVSCRLLDQPAGTSGHFQHNRFDNTLGPCKAWNEGVQRTPDVPRLFYGLKRTLIENIKRLRIRRPKIHFGGEVLYMKSVHLGRPARCKITILIISGQWGMGRGDCSGQS